MRAGVSPPNQPECHSCTRSYATWLEGRKLWGDVARPLLSLGSTIACEWLLDCNSPCIVLSDVTQGLRAAVGAAAAARSSQAPPAQR